MLPGDSPVDACEGSFADYVGRPNATSALGLLVMLPHDSEAARGVSMVCAALTLGGGLPGATKDSTGSVKGVDR